MTVQKGLKDPDACNCLVSTVNVVERLSWKVLLVSRRGDWGIGDLKKRRMGADLNVSDQRATRTRPIHPVSIATGECGLL